MTNDIIEIARQCGFTHLNYDEVLCTVDQLTKFAELIQARAVPDGYVVVKAGLLILSDAQCAAIRAHRAAEASKAAQKGSV